ncbi:MAG: pyruvate formate lyase family protein [Gallintestinimicrobium sp.]
MDVPRRQRAYSFFGCGEYMLAVQSIGTPNTALNVAKVLELVLHDGINPATGILSGPLAAGQECKKLQDIICYEELEELLKTYLTFFIEIAGGFEELVYDVDGKEAEFLQFSCLQDDCMTRGRGMLNGGYRYLGGTVETYGNITLSDSMEAIRKVVFEEKRCTLQELVEALDCDFSGKEMLQQALLDAEILNDNEEADEIAVRLHELICQTTRNQKTDTAGFFPGVLINNMNVTLRVYWRMPDGRNAPSFCQRQQPLQRTG